MNKKTSFACFILLIIGLISSTAINTAAQNKVSAEIKQAQKTIVADKGLQNYIDISSLPTNKRPAAFSALSAEDKANLFKLHLALQFVKRPNLTKEQRDLILDSIPMIAPETYNLENAEARAKAQQSAGVLEAKSKTLFPFQEAFEIFASLSGNQEDVSMLQKYQNAISLPTMLERRKLFREASPSDRSDLWKIQMAYYLATYQLNKNQQEFILEVISLSNSEAFVVPSAKNESKTAARTALSALEERAVKLFTKENVFTIFMSLGSEKTISKDDTNQAERPPAPTECGCNWWCSPCNSCQSGGCAETTSGCGWTLGSACTGKCVVNIDTCPRGFAQKLRI
jgi:hypothetical protein